MYHDMYHDMGIWAFHYIFLMIAIAIMIDTLNNRVHATCCMLQMILYMLHAACCMLMDGFRLSIYSI